MAEPYNETERLYDYIYYLENLLRRIGDVLMFPETLPGAVEWALKKAALRKCPQCDLYYCKCLHGEVGTGPMWLSDTDQDDNS